MYITNVNFLKNTAALREGSGSGKEARLPVLLALMGHANTRGRAWPTQGKLAEETGMSRDSVIHAMAWLAEKRAIFLLPSALRMGKEKQVKKGIAVWQLTGFLIVDEQPLMYWFFTPDALASHLEELDSFIDDGWFDDAKRFLLPPPPPPETPDEDAVRPVVSETPTGGVGNSDTNLSNNLEVPTEQLLNDPPPIGGSPLGSRGDIASRIASFGTDGVNPSANDKKKSSHTNKQRKENQQLVQQLWGVQPAIAANICAVIFHDRNISIPAWKAAKLPEPIDKGELNRWATWFKAQEWNTSGKLPTTPDKIQHHIGKWFESKKEQKQKAKEVRSRFL